MNQNNFILRLTFKYDNSNGNASGPYKDGRLLCESLVFWAILSELWII